MFSISEWKRRILTYFAYGARQRIRSSTKDQVLRAISGTSNENANKAFDELVTDGLVESADNDKFFTINFDRRGEILDMVSAEPEERLDLAQPLQDADYDLQFAVQSK